MEILNSTQNIYEYAIRKLNSLLNDIRKNNPEKVFEIDCIQQYNQHCQQEHKNSKIFEIAIHQYQPVPGSKKDIATLSDSKMKACICDACIEMRGNNFPFSYKFKRN